MVYIPTELLVEILERLPWPSRRRLRLVCRSWRNLVHNRTTEMQQCRDAVPLVVTTESAYVIDYDLESKTYIPRELWAGGGTDVDGGHKYKHMKVVGVCNGVLCLGDNTKLGGAITLVNPATGDVLVLPPIPCDGLFRRHNSRRPDRSWHQAYSFGFHHKTGQYKVVHVPCFFKTKETLQVFTLGEASWREVPAPGDRCRLDAGVVSVNGATYWVREGSERIVSFDLENERVQTVKALPTSGRPICNLTEVHRRLIVATSDHSSKPNNVNGYRSIEVWVLERTRNKETWTHQYILRFSYPPRPSIQPTRQCFTHGDYVLVVGDQGQKLFGYTHRPTYQTKQECSTAYLNNYCYRKTIFSDIRYDVCRTFAYIKTTEALSVYRRWRPITN